MRRAPWTAFLGLAWTLAIATTGLAQSDAPPAPEAEEKPAAPVLEHATFGGGCFWCMEAVFERIPGVESVVSGYAGGPRGRRPSYQSVHTGLTGHAEVIRITYDPEVIAFDDLLDFFWAAHDPTTLNRQGPDFGTQYRSIILYESESQREAALASYRKLTAEGAFASPIVTELEPLRAFYPAERYHQDYFRRNRNAPYCRAEIAPKVAALRRMVETYRAKVKAEAPGEQAPSKPDGR